MSNGHAFPSASSTHSAALISQNSTEFAQFLWRNQPIHIEYQRVEPSPPSTATAPLIVFLHEGLGSVAMWRSYPQTLCHAIGARGLVYSRLGYGQSSPRAEHEHWQADFLHQQALEVLPALLQALHVDTAAQPTYVLGHSDGGSIALIAAASAQSWAQHLAGVVVLAPHIMVEDISIRSIQAVRAAYLENAGNNKLRQGLARYHADVDSAFWGWNNVWLSDAFRPWSIAAELPRIGCPVLAVQGVDDAYGTLAQINGIAAAVPATQLLALENCGHNIHRDQAAQLTQAVHDFVRRTMEQQG